MTNYEMNSDIRLAELGKQVMELKEKNKKQPIYKSIENKYDDCPDGDIRVVNAIKYCK